jgi:hypothetical protein
VKLAPLQNGGGHRSPIPLSPSEENSVSSESRISYLTETLLLKQSLLEAVTTDKTALTLKIEKLEVIIFSNKHRLFTDIEMTMHWSIRKPIPIKFS